MRQFTGNRKMLTKTLTSSVTFMSYYVYCAIIAISIPVFSFILKIDWTIVLIAFLGSVVGTAGLLYARRLEDRQEMAWRGGVSTSSGVILGSFGVWYLNLEAIPAQLLIYWLMGLISIFVIKSLVFISETNMTEGIKKVIEKNFGIKFVNRSHDENKDRDRIDKE